MGGTIPPSVLGSHEMSAFFEFLKFLPLMLRKYSRNCLSEAHRFSLCDTWSISVHLSALKNGVFIITLSPIWSLIQLADTWTKVKKDPHPHAWIICTFIGSSNDLSFLAYCSNAFRLSSWGTVTRHVRKIDLQLYLLPNLLGISRDVKVYFVGHSCCRHLIKWWGHAWVVGVMVADWF